jgi:lysophospholipase L1-like esterase
VAILGYVISRATGDSGFTKLGESTGPSYRDRNVPAGKQAYRVCAVDFEENLGPWSETLVAETKGTAFDSTLGATADARKLYREDVRQIHDRGRARVRKGHVTLYGDSLTGATLYQYAVLSALLKQTLDAFGYAGQTTAFAKDRIKATLDEQNPEFIFILFGTNNDKSPAGIEAAMEDLRTVISACHAHGTVAILGTIPPRGFDDPRSLPEAAYNTRLIGLARELSVPVAQIFEAIQSSGPRQTYIAADGVHWTAQGMELAGRAWGKAFDDVRFVLRDQP